VANNGGTLLIISRMNSRIILKGNPVGSLTEEQKEIIVGTLLGDGYMRCKTNAHLSFKQQNFLIKNLFKNWKIESHLNKDKQYQRIRLTLKGTKVLKELIKKYIIPSMEYKLPL
jgi:hypothetical protein